MRRYRSCRILIVIIALSAVALCQQKSRLTYDGHWWLSASSATRDGFIGGFFDCYRWDFYGQRSTAKTDRELIELLNNYYTAHNTALAQPIPRTVLRNLELSHLPPQNKAGGERWTNRHTFFDGGFWSNINEEERRGFVAGYVACHHYFGGNKKKFREGDAYYTPRISDWYEHNPQKEDAKIADVLAKVADK